MGKTGWAQGQIRDDRGVILPCGAPNCFAHSRADCEINHKLFRRAKKLNSLGPRPNPQF